MNRFESKSKNKNLTLNVYLYISLYLGCAVIGSVQANDYVDVVVVDPISDQPILTGVKLDKSREKIIEFVVSADEYEPASFVLTNSSKNLENVSFEVSNLVSDVGEIKYDNIDIKLVKKWFQAPGAWRSHRVEKKGVAQLVPELLLNDLSLLKVDTKNKKNYLRINGVYEDISTHKKNVKPVLWDAKEFNVSDAKELRDFSLKKGELQQVWLTLHIEKNTPSGVYTGSIKIKNNKDLLSTITIKAQVLPFNLEKPLLEYSIYYRGRYHPSYGTVSSEYKNEKQLSIDFKDMKAHGICCPTVYQRIRAKYAFEKVEGKTQKELLKKYMSVRSDAGLQKDNIYYIGLLANAKVDHTTLPYFSQVAEVMQDENVESLYLYGEDEAKKDGLVKQLSNWKILKELGYKIFAAGSNGHSLHTKGMTDLLVLQGKYNEQEKKSVKDVGGKIFAYANPQIGLENPLVYRKNYGYSLWLSGYDGVMDYAYQHSMGSIWNDFDHPIYRDLVFSYPTSTGTINTIAWEGFREAVDDVRYLTTLAMKSEAGRDDPKKWGSIYLNELAVSGITNSQAIRKKIIADLLSLERAQ